MWRKSKNFVVIHPSIWNHPRFSVFCLHCDFPHQGSRSQVFGKVLPAVKTGRQKTSGENRKKWEFEKTHQERMQQETCWQERTRGSRLREEPARWESASSGCLQQPGNFTCFGKHSFLLGWFWHASFLCETFCSEFLHFPLKTNFVIQSLPSCHPASECLKRSFFAKRLKWKSLVSFSSWSADEMHSSRENVYG